MRKDGEVMGFFHPIVPFDRSLSNTMKSRKNFRIQL